MMAKHELTYALPMSYTSLEGGVTVTEDSVLGSGPASAPETTVSLSVGADTRDQTVTLKTGGLFDTAASFEVTDDGRLKSAESESTGQLGKVVLGVVGAGSVVAGLATGVPAGSLAALIGGAAARHEIAPANRPAPETPEAKIATAYRTKFPSEADHRATYLDLVKRTVTRIAELSERLVGDQPDNERWRDAAELRHLRALLPDLRAELDRLNEHFGAWRATTIATRVEKLERRFPLDKLHAAAVKITETGIETGDPEVAAAWEQLGVAVLIEPVPGEAASGEVKRVGKESRENEIIVRVPRVVRVSIYERADGKPVLREQGEHPVMDSACETELVKLRRSWWAKRKVAVGFSDLGAMKSYSHSSESSASAAATTLGSLPEAVSGGLEQAAKVRTQLATLTSADLDAQLSRAKKRVELKQQELTAAGLTATEKDHAELERLKQEAEMASKRKSIVTDTAKPAAPDPSATEIASLKQQVELMKLRLELERLRTYRAD